ncbi:MAG: hypothetical protein ICV51_18090 [Flavisolibacter sp.]|nr:hypothetical protein [Flavisolibacter sp.]
MKRQQLIDLLHALRKHVLFTANQDPVMAASSGFTVAKEPQAAPPMGQQRTQPLAMEVIVVN